jgi:hypothetical protein
MVAILLPAALYAAPGNLQVTGVTPTQAVVTYTAPDEAACLVEVSESPSYTPVALDVDGTKFAGANQDLSRPGTVVNGWFRTVVVGTRRYERGLDGRIYSRALPSGATHYLRVTCGGAATLAFRTAALPFGAAYVDPPQVSAEFPGNLVLPTLYDTARGARVIDAMTGTAMYRVSKAGDLDFGDTQTNLQFTEVILSPAWTNPNNLLAPGGGTADYNGASCGSTCDFINLERTPMAVFPGNSADYVKLYLSGSGSDSSAANRTVEACLSFTTLCDGDFKELVLPFSPGTVSTGAVRGDMWRPPVALAQITGANLTAENRIRVLIRKKTAVGSISIDHAYFDLGVSAPQGVGSGGNYTICSDVQDGNGFFLCTSNTGGARAVLYKLKTSVNPPEIRYLGYLPNVSGGQCLTVGFSPALTHRMYCHPSSTPGAWQLDYTGNSEDKPAPWAAEISATQLTANLTQAVKDFVTANGSQYTIAFDETKFGCALSTPPIVQGDYLQIACRRGSQDSYAWLAVWHLGTGVAAAYPSWQHPYSRWCGLHSFEEVGQQNVYLWTAQRLGGGGTGLGPYRTTLAAAITAAETGITVAGEPTSAAADNFLMNAEVGDTLAVDGELMTVTGKGSSTSLVVARGAFGTIPAAHASGATVTYQCASSPSGNLYELTAPMTAWKYGGDPYGKTTDGTHLWTNHFMGHMTARANRAVNNNAWAESEAGVNLVETVKNFPYPFSVASEPAFAGRIPPAAGITYQTHPTWHNVTGDAYSQGIFADTRPLIGGNLISEDQNQATCDPTLLLPAPGGCAAQRQAGTNDVYKYTFSGSDRPQAALAVRQLAVFAVAGVSTLANASGPGSSVSDATPYRWCYALAAGECRAGSSAGDMFLVAPGVNRFHCTGGEVFGGNADLCIMERAGGTLSTAEHSTEVKQVNVWRSRDVLNVNTFSTTPRYSSGASVKHLPDGSGILISVYRAEREDLYLIRTPEYGRDTVDRQTFVPVAVTATSAPAGTSRMVVEFGSSPSLRCSENRAEECFAVSAAVDENSPFLWASELTAGSGVACAGGCTVTIPALPDRAVYYRRWYRDAAGTLVGMSGLEVVAP